LTSIPDRDVHRGWGSAAAAPLPFKKHDAAPLPRRVAQKSKSYRAAAAPRSFKKQHAAPLPRRVAQKHDRCRDCINYRLK